MLQTSRRRRQLAPQALLGVVTSLAICTGLWIAAPVAAVAECNATPTPAASSLEIRADGSISATPTTIAALLTRSSTLDAASSTVWSVEGNVQQFQQLADGGLRIFLADPSDPTQTLIAGVPDPACIPSAGLPLVSAVQAARTAVLVTCGSSPTPAACGRARVSGLAASSTDTSGVASTGVELNPTVGFELVTTATAAPEPILGTKTLSGIGPTDSLPFLFEPGGYTMTWTASAPTTDWANFVGFVKPVNVDDPRWIPASNTILRPNETRSGSVTIPAGASGPHYFSTGGAAQWSVSITRTEQDVRGLPNPVPASAGPPPPALPAYSAQLGVSPGEIATPTPIRPANPYPDAPRLPPRVPNYLQGGNSNLPPWLRRALTPLPTATPTRQRYP